jgi:gliding motility-associated-like protein
MFKKLFKGRGLLLSRTTIVAFFLLSIFQFLGFSVHAQNQLSNFGREFWLAFAENNNSSLASLRIYITSKVNTQATVTTNSGSNTYNIVADSTTEVILNAVTFSAQLRTTSPIVENKGIRITSSNDITVFASNVQNYTNDATVVLPKSALGIGSEYMFNMNVLGSSPSGLLFVATEDSTIIRFFNKPTGFPDSITLNRFQVYMVPYYNNATTIRAVSRKNCKPFAVFFTNRCTQVGSCAACDHLYSQVLPISKWSTRYVATPMLNQTSGYEYSIVALEDSTRVSINGGTPVLLQRGQRTRGLINSQIITCFDANKPINVQQYLRSLQCHSSGSVGDPALTELNATNQTIPRATFSSLTGGFITQHYVNIIVDSAYKNLLLIDSLPVKKNKWMTSVGCGRYAVYRDSISAGSHTIINDSGFIAYAYGFTGFESYLYSIGASYENQVYNFNIVAPKRCPGDSVVVQKTGDSLRSVYFLQGNRLDSGSRASYVFNRPGSYKIQMIATSFVNECADTITKFVEIGGPPKVFPNDTTICNPFEIIVRIDTNRVDSFKWDIPNYTADTLLIDTRGKYKVQLIDTFGCSYTDSVFVYLYRDPIAGLVVPNFSCFGDTSKFINRSIDTSQITDLRYFLLVDSTETYFSDSILNLVVADTGLFQGVFVASNGGVCNDTIPFSTRIRPKPEVKFVVDTSQLCAKNNLFNFTNQTKTFNYPTQYRWDFGDNDTSSSLSPSHTYLSWGSFIPKLKAVNNFGCKDSSSLMLTVYPSPTPSFVLSDTIACLRNNLFQATSSSTILGDSIVSYSWKYKNALSNQKNLTNISFDSIGKKQITHIVRTDKGCADSITREIEILPNPQAAYVSNSLQQCLKGNEFNLRDTSVHTSKLKEIIWGIPQESISDTGSLFKVKLLQEDTFAFYMHVEDSFGCRDTALGQLVVHPQAHAGIQASDTLECFRFQNFNFISTSTISSTDSITQYFWEYNNRRDTAKNVFGVVFDTSNQYTVKHIVTTKYNCSDTAAIQIFVKPHPQTEIILSDSNSLCLKGNAYQFFHSVEHNSSIRKYNWEIPSLNWKDTSEYPLFSFPYADTFQLLFSVTDTFGCMDSSQQTIFIRPQANLSFVSDTACLRDSVTLRSISSVEVGTIVKTIWDFGNNELDSGLQVKKLYTSPGLYTVRIKTETDQGCKDTLEGNNSVLIRPLPIPVFVLSDTISCLRNNLFQATSSSTILGDSIVSYSWKYKNALSDQKNLINISFDSIGKKQITHIVRTDKGCADSITREIEILPNPKAAYVSNSLQQCLKGNEFNLRDTSVHTSKLKEIIWGIPQESISDTGSLFKVKLLQEDTFAFYMHVEDSFGCRDTALGQLVVHPQAHAGIQASDTLECFRFQNFNFNSTSTISSTDSITQYFWEYNNRRDTAKNVFGVVFDTSNQYTVKHIVTTRYNCADTAAIQIFVKPHPQTEIILSDSNSLCLKGNAYQFFHSVEHNSSIKKYNWEIPSLNWKDTSEYPLFSFPYADTFQLHFSVIDTFGCMDSSQQTIFIRPQANLSFVSDTACLRDSVTLHSISSVEVGTIVKTIWDFGNNELDSGLQVKKLYTSPGLYTVRIKTETDQGCKDTLDVNNAVLIRPLPIPVFVSSLPVCENTMLTVQNLTVDTGQHANSKYFIHWYGNQIEENRKSFDLLPQDTGVQQAFVSAVNTFGCRDSSILDFRVIPLPVANFSFPYTVQCLRGNIFEAENLSEGFSYPLSYFWDFGAAITSADFEPVFSYPANGTYPMFLKVSNTFGCENILRDTFSIDFYPAPLISIQSNLDSQCLFGNSFIFANNSSISSGSFETKIGFEGLDTLSILDSLAYTFLQTGLKRVDFFINSNFQCKDTFTTFVRVWEMPNAEFVTSSNSGCEKQNLFTFNNTSTASEAMTFVWNYDTFSQSDSISQVSHVFPTYGTFPVQLEAISPNNCRDTFVIPIIVNPVPIPMAFSPMAEQCYNYHSVDLFSTTTVASGSYQSFWEVEELGAYNSDSVLGLQFLVYGNKQVKYKSVSDSLCSDSVTFNVVLNPSPVAGFDLDKSNACLRNNSFGFTSTSSIASGFIDSFLWYNDTYTEIANTASGKYSFSDSGEHFVSHKVISDKGCSSDTLFKGVRLYQNPVAEFTVNYMDSCFFNNAIQINSLAEIFNGKGNTIFSISDSSIFKDTIGFDYSFAKADTFSVQYIVQDLQRCSDTSSKQVIIRPQPLARIAVEEIQPCLRVNHYVFKDSSLSHGVAYTRNWTIPDAVGIVSDSIYKHSFASSGTKKLSLFVQGPFGCSSSDSMSVEVFPKNNLMVDTSASAYCLNEQDFMIQYAGQEKSSDLRQIIWKFGDNTIVLDSQVNKKFLGIGSYRNVLITENSFNCFDTMAFVLDVFPLPFVGFDINDTLWCFNNQALELNSTSTFPFGFIKNRLWEFGDGDSDTGQNISTKTYANSGLYQILHIAIANNNCRDSIVKNVSLFNNPIASFISDTLELCERNNLFNLTSNSSPASNIQQNFWEIPSLAELDSGQIFQIQFSKYGNYPFALISLDKQGCADTVAGLIRVYPQSNLEILADTVCFGETSSLRDFSTLDSGTIVQKLWLLGDKSSHTGSTVSHTFTKPGEYDARLVTMTDAGCLDTFTEIGIAMVRSLPKPDFNFQKILDSLQFTGYQFTDLSTGNTSLNYQWLFDKYGSSESRNPFWLFADTGRMVVNLTVTDSFGCNKDTSKSFVAYPNTKPFVPNAFSPNQNNLNEVFKVEGVVYAKDFKLQIYNRWGEMLFESNDIGQGWDGTFRDKPVHEGVYVYKISYVNLEGDFVRLFGDLTLLK